MGEASEICLSLAGLDDSPGLPWAGGARRAIEWAAGLGFGGVRLDAATPGVRARDLDRSARRDLGAHIRRAGLWFGGLDLWIPDKHFADPARVDRAVAAATGAIGLAEELGGLVGPNGGRSVSLTMPKDVEAGALAALSAAAESAGVVLADHAWPASGSPPFIRAGLDPATVLLAGDDPARAASRLGERLAVARLSDADAQGRRPLGDGSGRLDLTAYAVAIATGGAEPQIVVDLRGLTNQGRAATRALTAWAGALPEIP